MSRVLCVASVMAGVALCGASMVRAESRPIERLPGDVVRWSTMWTEIPKAMYEVGRQEGPLAAVTWGPTKGAAAFVQSTTKEVWDVVKPDKESTHDAQQDNPKGLIFRYSF